MPVKPKSLQTAKNGMLKAKFSGIITLKTNAPKIIVNSIIEPKRARFSSFVVSVKIAIHKGNPNPNETPIKNMRNIILTMVAFIINISAKEENTPTKVHAKRKLLRLVDLFIKEAPAIVDITVLKSKIV